MSSDADDSLGLFTAGSKHRPNYDVGSVNTAGALASASSSDSDDESFSSGHMYVSTGHRVHSIRSYGLLVGFVIFSIDQGVPNVTQPSHFTHSKASQRNQEMMSQIPKISGNC